jgi:hypothetical protein
MCQPAATNENRRLRLCLLQGLSPAPPGFLLLQGRSGVPRIEAVATMVAPVSAEPTAAVTLKACRRLHFGQVLRVVGGTPEMGDWNPANAPSE